MNLAKHDSGTEMPLNMTPMIDVVFLLIIFFMVITDLTQQDLEELELPVAQHATEDKPDPDEWRPILNIPHDGRMVVKRETYYDPERDDGKAEPYAEVKNWLAMAARRMDLEHITSEKTGVCSCGRIPQEHPPGSGDFIPADFLLIRADQVTPFKHIQKVMEFCGVKGVEIWKVQLAAAEPPKSQEQEP